MSSIAAAALVGLLSTAPKAWDAFRDSRGNITTRVNPSMPRPSRSSSGNRSSSRRYTPVPASGRSGGTPGLGVRVFDGSSGPSPDSFQERAAAARAALDPEDREQVQAMLESEDPAEVLAVLDFARRERRPLKVSVLREVLLEARRPEVAEAAVELLELRGTPEAVRALVESLEAHGRARERAVEALAALGPPHGLEVLLKLARRAHRRDAASLAALRALAAYPDARVDLLLRRLAGDRSRTLRETAEAALARRRELGVTADG